MLLETRTVEKPWGRDDLPAPFTAPDGKRIGEIWFEPPAALDQLLIKYIFTSEKLSVQVHPDDDQAEAAGHGRQGKSECWLVLDAEPDARLGIGFADELGADALRAAALDGSVEDRMTWHQVRAGDFFYIPANTVHAIGGGISLIEVQQNSDITYRLYDYGRPRELHLDAAVDVAKARPYSDECRKQVPERGEMQLVDGPHFRLWRFDGQPSAEPGEALKGAVLVLPVSGDVTVAGEAVSAGDCALAEGLSAVQSADDTLWLAAAPLT